MDAALRAQGAPTLKDANILRKHRSVGHNDATQSRWVTTQMYDELADGKQAQKKLGRVC